MGVRGPRTKSREEFPLVLSVRLNQELYDQLTARAEAEDRSVAAQARHELKQALSRPTLGVAKTPYQPAAQPIIQVPPSGGSASHV